MAKIRNTDNEKGCWGHWGTELSYFAGKDANWFNTFPNWLASTYYSETCLPYDLAILLLGIYKKEIS